MYMRCLTLAVKEFRGRWHYVYLLVQALFSAGQMLLVLPLTLGLMLLRFLVACSILRSESDKLQRTTWMCLVVWQLCVLCSYVDSLLFLAVPFFLLPLWPGGLYHIEHLVLVVDVLLTRQLGPVTGLLGGLALSLDCIMTILNLFYMRNFSFEVFRDGLFMSPEDKKEPEIETVVVVDLQENIQPHQYGF